MRYASHIADLAGIRVFAALARALPRIVSDPAATDFVAVMPIFEPEAAKVIDTPVERAVGAAEGP